MSEKRNARGLTPKMEKFAQGLAEGKQQRQAFIDAGYSSKGGPKTIDPEASRKAKLKEVQARLAELQAIADAGALASLEQIQADLVAIATDPTKSDSVRLKAYDQLTRIQGGYKDRMDIKAVSEISMDDKRAIVQELLGE